jgi:molecular chaperone DnaK
MGESFKNIKSETKHISYSLVSGENDTPRIDIDGKKYTPQEISAMILQKNEKDR